MRAIFVNHCHPDCPHVCGTRAREFANALARCGHRIVLLTETLRRDDPALAPVDLAGALAAHDWSAPFRLAVRPRSAPVMEALRRGRLPAVLRAPVILYQYLVRGGMFTDWRDASAPYWAPLASAFRPEVAWGIFGNTDAWAIAQGIAGEAGCPWVRDIKDQWTAFIPSLFRGLLAWRYGDAKAATALSRANAADIEPWSRCPATVVYSGVPSELLSLRPGEPDAFTITLVGGVYEPEALKILIAGLNLLLARGACGDLDVHYVGIDGGAVSAALNALSSSVRVHVRGQIPFKEYASHLARSHVNVYLRSSRAGWWHHKLVELLAVRRPILCIPGEIDEARLLARRMNGWLVEAAGPAAVAEALECVWRERKNRVSDNVEALKALTWDATAAELAAVLVPSRSA